MPLGSAECDEKDRETHDGALEKERSERFPSSENDLPGKLETITPRKLSHEAAQIAPAGSSGRQG